MASQSQKMSPSGAKLFASQQVYHCVTAHVVEPFNSERHFGRNGKRTFAVWQIEIKDARQKKRAQVLKYRTQALSVG